MRKEPVLLFLVLLCVSVAAVTFEEARDAYQNASVDVLQLRHEGIPIQSLEDVLRQMNGSLFGRDEKKLREIAFLLNETDEGRPLALQYFAMLEEANRSGLNPGQNFSLVLEGAGKIDRLRVAAFEARDSLRALNEELDALNESLNLTRVIVSLSKAQDAFTSERFAEVPGLVNQTRSELDDARVESARERALLRLARRNVRAYVEDHWRGLLIALGVVAVLSLWLFLELRASFGAKKLDVLHEEMRSVRDLLFSTQKEYYGGSLGRPAYLSRMNAYHQKERTLKAQLAALESLVRLYRKMTIFHRFKRL